MKLYVAGAYAANFGKSGNIIARLTENEKAQRLQVKHLLESYHYVHRKSYVEKMRKDKVQVFLDSGAFSAFTMGVNVDIKAYCRYVLENEDIIEKVGNSVCASVLDGIGDPLKTYENQKEMERLGVRALPCFHYGEDERYLDYYVANYEYITLGGMVPISTPQLYHWLDRIWEKHLTDGAGRPKVRVHGFGLTTMPLVERYPWFSVDSSSWVQVARVGGMMLYPEARVLSVSDQSPSRRVEGQHIDTLPEIQRIEIERRLTDMGVDVKRMRETYLSRWAYNIMTFSKLGDLYDSPDPKFIPEKIGLFD
jgi:hypothetical protein